MADIRISELVDLQNAQDDDVIIINDASSNITKKITRERFLLGVSQNLRDSGENSVALQDLTVNNDLFVGGDISTTGNVEFGSLTDVVNDVTVYGIITSEQGLENYDSDGYLPTTSAIISYFQRSDISYTFSLGSTSGSTNYTFTDTDNKWFPVAENDPVLYLRRGETYIFNNIPSQHPLEIRVSNGGAAYSTGVVNNGGAGAVTFTVPMSAPSTLYYQCTVHSSMGNTINIV